MPIFVRAGVIFQQLSKNDISSIGAYPSRDTPLPTFHLYSSCEVLIRAEGLKSADTSRLASRVLEACLSLTAHSIKLQPLTANPKQNFSPYLRRNS